MQLALEDPKRFRVEMTFSRGADLSPLEVHFNFNWFKSSFLSLIKKSIEVLDVRFLAGKWERRAFMASRSHFGHKRPWAASRSGIILDIWEDGEDDPALCNASRGLPSAHDSSRILRLLLQERGCSGAPRQSLAFQPALITRQWEVVLCLETFSELQDRFFRPFSLGMIAARVFKWWDSSCLCFVRLMVTVLWLRKVVMF